MLVERHYTLKHSVKEQYELFENEYEEAKLYTAGKWFSLIEPKFKTVVSGICNGLADLYYKRFCHGNLLNGVVVKVEDGLSVGRILTASPSVQRYSQDVAINDVANLFRLMVGILGCHNRENSMSDAECDPDTVVFTLRSQLPTDLQLFLLQLAKFENEAIPMPSQQFIWVVDNPYIWNPEQKNSFVRKVWHLHVNYPSLISQIGRDLPDYFNPTKIEAWQNLVHEDKQLSKVATHFSNKPTDKVIGVSEVYSNGHEHYNKGMIDKLSDVAYSDFVNEILQYPSAQIRDFLTGYLSGKHRPFMGGFYQFWSYIIFLESRKLF